MRTRKGCLGMLVGAVFMFVSVCAIYGGQVDLLDFGKIENGMSEGEVLIRLGQPDHETFDGYAIDNQLLKTYYYFSEPERYQNITTIIRLKGGRVIDKDRTYVPFD